MTADEGRTTAISVRAEARRSVEPDLVELHVRVTGSGTSKAAARDDVDDDNAGWALVRADAIRAAVRKGQDYAAALAGEVVTIEQVSDAGLLSRSEPELEIASAVGFRMESGDSGGNTGLDPVPQTLHATIDARFAETTGALPAR